MNGAMKKNISRSAKKIAVLGLFLTGALVLNAQTNNPNPGWMVSKGVQKVANKKAFEAESLRSISIQANSLSQSWVITKGVNRATGTSSQAGNVVSKGIPAWTISKGVHKIGK
jgi:hypothetical protein